MKKNNGLTLIEIILAIALLGIISVSLIPVFASQVKNIIIGSGITEDAFDDQGIVEEIIFNAKSKMQKDENMSDIPQWSMSEDVTVFGQDVSMNKISYVSTNHSSRKVAVYLSKDLAKKEINNNLNVSNVYIEVSDDPLNLVADLTLAPTLTAMHDENSTQSGYFANLYRWWRTQPGVDPNNLIFPNDYVLIAVSQGTKVLTDLLDNVGPNSYVILTTTPVDIHGNRGSSVMSSNKVYVRGEEWRIGALPWVDMDNNYELDSTDYELSKESISNKLDAQNPYPNPAEPSINLDLTEGSLFVPMGVQPINLSEPGNQAIELDDDELLDWAIERNINLAKDIKVLNGNDIKLVSGLGSFGGSIFLHPYVKIDSEGKVVTESGIVQLLDSGVSLSTAGDLVLETASRGGIYLYNKAEIEANNINMRARGPISINTSNIKADGNITLENNIDTFIAGARNINLQEVNFESTKVGNQIYLNSPNEINFKGGSWSINQTVQIPDGKSIVFEKANNRTNNLGVLNLGNTGSVRFKNSMITDLSNQLRLKIEKRTNTEMRIVAHNYTRNIAYASPSKNIIFSSQDNWKDIGGSNSNIEFSASILSGNGNVSDFKFSFDGNDTIKIEKNTSIETELSTVKLDFRDKYSNREIKGVGLFSYSIDSNGNATIVVEEVPVDTYTLAFDSDGGTTVNPMIISYGDPITQPQAPTKFGHIFNGWEPSLPSYMPDRNLNVKAKWNVGKYKVTFDSNGGSSTEPISKSVDYGAQYGVLPLPTRQNYSFKGWYTAREAGELVSQSSIVMSNFDHILYARWEHNAITVSFNSNGGIPNSLKSKEVYLGTPYGKLETVTRNNYEFKGWYTQKVGGNLINEVEIVSIITNHTLYAQWKGKQITVTFDSNGGSAPLPKEKKVFYNEKYETLPTVSKDQNEFLGWYTQKDGGVVISNDSTVTATTNHTLYAKWKDNSCPFIYSFDGEEYHFEQQPVPYAINKAFESTTYGTLRKLSEYNGLYHIRVTEELESETYVEGVNLYSVDYISNSKNSEVFVDIYGKAHTIKEKIYPESFIDSFGNDWIDEITTKGEIVKSSNTLYDEGINVITYDAEFKIPKYAAKTAKLMVRPKMTSFLGSMEKWFSDIIDGKNNVWWIQELLQGSTDLKSALDIMSLEVDLWDGREWIQQGKIEVAYHLYEDFLIPIDISSVKNTTDQLKIRFRSGAAFFEIDEVSIDFTENEKMKISKLTPESAKTKQGKDIKEIIEDFQDEKRVKLQSGDYIDIYYKAPELAEGYKRGFITEFKGYLNDGLVSKTNDITDRWNKDTTQDEIIAAVLEQQPESIEYLEKVDFLNKLAKEISSQPFEVKIKRIIVDNLIPWLKSKNLYY